MNVLLHFALGPVQSFISQARRTRDLYAGSWLLSHLAWKAMEAAAAAEGKILVPDWSTLRKRASSSTSRHAVAPNRFLAEFPDEATAANAGRAAAQAVQQEWQRFADAVWQHFLQPVAASGRDTPGIWDRQVRAFWEITWAVAPDPQRDPLQSRKHWRTLPDIVEPGDHCTLMGHWQELSGYVRSLERHQQDGFWQAVRDRCQEVGASALDLQQDERLCAIAFIKRFFPLLSGPLLGRPLGLETWPSTVTMAAVPWLRALKSGPSHVLRQCAAYARRVAAEPGALTGGTSRLAGLQTFPPEAGDFPRLNGNFLNRNTLANERSTPLRSETDRTELLEELRLLEQASGNRAGNFYAILLMDGDSMGALLREQPAERVTACLSAFATKAPEIIEQELHSGVCVYAGGDDLLAMLPLDSALQVVIALRQAYVEAFRQEGISQATTCAGLVLAHYRCTFSRTLQYAHHLLHTVAKEQAGRDAIAIGVLKPGGIACEWVEKFDRFIQGNSHCFAPLIEAFRNPAGSERGGLSSSFLYNLQHRLAPLFDNPSQEGATQSWEDSRTLSKLVAAEYLHGRVSRTPEEAAAQREAAEKLAQNLLSICTRADKAHPRHRRPDLSALRLLKFLAMEGKEGSE